MASSDLELSGGHQFGQAECIHGQGTWEHRRCHERQHGVELELRCGRLVADASQTDRLSRKARISNLSYVLQVEKKEVRDQHVTSQPLPRLATGVGRLS